MAISFSRYIEITSGVIASGSNSVDDLQLLMISDNPLLPIVLNSANADVGVQLDFNSQDASDVLQYFGANSQEYKIAAWYMSFVSKRNTQPNKFSVYRWIAENEAPRLYGDPATLGSIAAIEAAWSAGTFGLTLDGHTHTQVGMTGSPASYTDVATLLQTYIRAADVDTSWASATVTFDAVGGRFLLVGGAVATSTDIVIISPSDSLNILLGLNGPRAINSRGTVAQTLTQAMTNGGSSGNFGTFSISPTLTPSQAQFVELATWNQTQNVQHGLLVPVTAANAAAMSAALIGFPGVGMTLVVNPATDFQWLLPAAIFDASDYAQRNVSQNYMFQPYSLATIASGLVTDDASANVFDALRVNYVGETKVDALDASFYQRGVLTGVGSAPSDMTVFFNEIWLKLQAKVSFMNLLLAVGEVPTDNSGRAKCLTVLQSVIDQALFNGVISVGSKLNAIQIVAITDITGDALAFHQVQNLGYWVDVNFTSFVGLGGDTEWQMNYVLIYKKKDDIRKIVGSHALI